MPHIVAPDLDWELVDGDMVAERNCTKYVVSKVSDGHWRATVNGDTLEDGPSHEALKSVLQVVADGQFCRGLP